MSAGAPHRPGERPRERLLLVGNGMAGVRLLEELLARAPERYDITVVGAENHGAYNRILLSPLLAGEKALADIVTHAPDWYAERGIALHLGDPAVTLDRGARTVTTRSGRELRYDKLVLATGSKPFVLPVPGKDLPGVVAFREIGDVDAMLDAAGRYRRAVVIGGGLLGLEAASALAARGMDVTVVHLMDRLMERQLDAHAAALLQGNLEARGLKFVLEAQTAEIVARPNGASPLPLAGEGQGEGGRVGAVRLKDGRQLAADLVVMAAGIVPDTQLAKAAGLPCERGVLVDDSLRTFDAQVYAIGECVQHRKVCYGLVAPLYDQARTCAEQLAADDSAQRYEGSVVSTRLKVTGIELFSAGNFLGGDGTQDLVFRDPRRGIYKRLVLRGTRLEGALLYGDTQDASWYGELIQAGADVAHLRARLLFGRRFVEAQAA